MSKKVKSKVQPTEEELRINQDMIDIAKSDPETVEEVSDMTGISVNEIPLDKPTKTRGIGKFIIEKILTTNLTNKEILDEVIKNFDGAKTTMACIAWYKTKMRKEGKIGARVTKAKVKAEEVPA